MFFINLSNRVTVLSFSALKASSQVWLYQINILIGNMDNRTVCTLSKFSDDIMLRGAVVSWSYLSWISLVRDRGTGGPEAHQPKKGGGGKGGGEAEEEKE